MFGRFMSVAVLALAGGSAALGVETTSAGYTARSVALPGFAGELRVVPAATANVRYRLEGPKDRVDGTDATSVGDRLIIRVPPGEGGGTTVVTGAVGAVATGGGTASVTIGGDAASVEPTVLTLELPTGTDLELRGFVGTGTIGVPLGRLDAEVVAGDLGAGGVGPADLAIRGGGTIRVAAVREHLSMTLEGSGDITVASGTVERVEAVLQGAGSLAFGGDARTGMVRASGAGTVTLSRIASPPVVERDGAVEVIVGGAR